MPPKVPMATRFSCKAKKIRQAITTFGRLIAKESFKEHLDGRAVPKLQKRAGRKSFPLISMETRRLIGLWNNQSTQTCLVVANP